VIAERSTDYKLESSALRPHTPLQYASVYGQLTQEVV